MATRTNRTSRIRNRIAGAALLICSAALGACRTTPEVVPPASIAAARGWKELGITAVQETPHVFYRHSPWAGLSHRDMRTTEEHVLAVAKGLDIRPPRRLLYLVVSPEWLREQTGTARRSESIPRPGLSVIEDWGEHPGDRTGSQGSRASGENTLFDGVVLSVSATDLHEITHCVSGLLLSPETYLFRCPLTFEGLAVAWDGRPRERANERVKELWPSEGPLLPTDLIDSFPDAPAGRVDLAYNVSGSFVRYLLQRRGREDFREVFRARKDAFRSTFERVYGEPVESFQSRWLAELGLDSSSLEVTDE